jgi:EmrB/QacA subfamily drug resistance transporter
MTDNTATANRPALGTEETSPVGSALTGNARWWVLGTIGVGTFMSALDASVVNMLLPILSRALHTSIAGIEWVTTVYLLVISGLLLSVGRAGDLFGHKRIYISGFAMFVVGSALCGIAGSSSALVALRVIQALGAAALMGTGPAILTRSFPANERGKALGALGTFTYLGLTAGPSLGGWLATAFSWRAVFYINVPIGVVAILLALRSVPDDRITKRDEQFDFVGASLFTAGLTALLIALNQGHAWGWGSRSILLLLGIAIVLLVIFIRFEHHRASPMLDLSLFQSHVFSASSVSALLNYACVYALLFVLPFLLIQGRGLDAQHAGLVLTAQPVVMAIVAPFSGSISDRAGTRWPAILGMLILLAGLLVVAMFVAAGSLWAIAGGLAIVGLGVGTFVSPNNSALMGAAPRHRQGIASGVLATARNVGMVLGVGIAGAVFTTVVAHVSPPSAALVAGVRASLFVAAGLALAGAGTSALR